MTQRTRKQRKRWTSWNSITTSAPQLLTCISENTSINLPFLRGLKITCLKKNKVNSGWGFMIEILSFLSCDNTQTEAIIYMSQIIYICFWLFFLQTVRQDLREPSNPLMEKQFLLNSQIMLIAGQWTTRWKTDSGWLLFSIDFAKGKNLQKSVEELNYK